MKNNSAFLFSSALAVILSLGMGCVKKPDDAKVSSEVQSKFSQDSGLASKQLSVQADGGVITLAGTVDNDAQREAAGRQAASVPGVKTVINNLQVSNEGKPSAVGEMAPPQPTNTQASNTPPPSGMARPVTTKKSSKSHDQASKSANTASDSGTGPMTARNEGASSASQGNMAPPADHPAAMQAPPPPPPAPRKFIIDQGTQLTVRLVDAIDSEKNQSGDTVRATLNAPLTSDGEQAVPAGVEVTGHLVSVKSAGKFAGQSEVVLQLDSISSGGQAYSIQTDQYKKTGSSRGKNTAEKVGGGAVIGGIIGALAGGGKGAAIGAAAGAGVGGGVQAATKSQQIRLPSETILNFTLQSPVTVVQAAAPDSGRKKLSDSQ